MINEVILTLYFNGSNNYLLKCYHLIAFSPFLADYFMEIILAERLGKNAVPMVKMANLLV